MLVYLLLAWLCAAVVALSVSFSRLRRRGAHLQASSDFQTYSTRRDLDAQTARLTALADELGYKWGTKDTTVCQSTPAWIKKPRDTAADTTKGRK